MKIIYFSILTLLSSLFLGACDSDSDTTEVVRITVEDGVIRIGQQSVIRLGVSFDEDDVFNDGDNVIVLIQLPVGISFVGGSAEIQGPFGDEDVSPQLFSCEGTQDVMLFDLDDEDLRFADDPSGDSNADLTFTVRGDAAVENGIISSRAGDNISFFGCDDLNFFDVQGVITVVE